MPAMITHDGRWRVDANGTGTQVVWYRLTGPDTDRVLPSMAALVAELDQRRVDLADLRDADSSRLP